MVLVQTSLQSKAILSTVLRFHRYCFVGKNLDRRRTGGGGRMCPSFRHREGWAMSTMSRNRDRSRSDHGTSAGRTGERTQLRLSTENSSS